MAGRLLESHVEYTRTFIKNTFMRLYEQKGLEKVTVNEICSVCEISRSTFYQYFDDKYELLQVIEDELLEGVQNLNLDMPEIPIRSTDLSIPRWTETASYIWEQRDYFRPLILSPGDPQFVHKWNRLIRDDYTQRLRADHFSEASIDMDLVSYFMASATIGLYEYWLQYRLDLTPREIAEAGSRLLWSSFYQFKYK